MSRNGLLKIMDRLPGELDPEDAADLIQKGAEPLQDLIAAPLQDLIAALHSKALVAELRQQRAARG